MSKKILNTLSSLLALACLPMVAHATGYNAIANGAWVSGATWSPSTPLPGTGIGGDASDSVYIGTTGSHNVTLDTDVGNLTNGQLYRSNPSTLTFNSGAQATFTTYFQIENGTMTVNSGASATTNGYLAFGNGSPAAAVNHLDIDGGAFTADTLVYFGSTTASVTNLLTVQNGGTFSTSGQVIYNGEANTTGNFSVLSGGIAGVDRFEFDGGADTGTSGMLRTITVDGGILGLTNVNPAATLNLGGLTNLEAYVQYEAGEIGWLGVTDLTEFNTFKTGAYTTWLNDGYFKTSSGYSTQDFLDGLTFVASIPEAGGAPGAVLAIPEISSASALMGLAMGMLVFITRRKPSH